MYDRIDLWTDKRLALLTELASVGADFAAVAARLSPVGPARTVAACRLKAQRAGLLRRRQVSEAVKTAADIKQGESVQRGARRASSARRHKKVRRARRGDPVHDAAAAAQVKPRKIANRYMRQHQVQDAGQAAKRAHETARLDLHLLRAANPFRPPAWRWDLAQHLIGAGRKPQRAYSDPTVAEAVRFRRSLQHRGQQLQLAEAWPHLFAAWQLFGAGSNDSLRQAVELLVLAGAEAELITDETGVPIHAIELYEKCFFDIRSRLSIPSVVTHSAIRPTELSTVDDDTQVAKRQLAYSGGVTVALGLIHNTFARCNTRSPDELPRQLAGDLGSNLALKAAVAVRGMDPGDPRNQIQLARWSLALQTLDHRYRVWREKNARTARSLAAGVQAMLSGLPAEIQKQFAEPPLAAVE